MPQSIVIPASKSRRAGLGLMLAATLVTRIPALPVEASTTASLAPTGSSGIAFTTNVPLVHQNLPLFSLTRTAAPTALIQSILAATNAPPLAMNGTQLVAKNAHGALGAYVDGVSGDAAVYPDFAAAPKVSSALSAASLESTAERVLSRADVIPKDATTAKIGSETPVFGTGHKRTAAKGLTGTPTARHLFTYVNTVRYAAGLRVVGKGSQAMVAVADDGSIRGLVRRWQAARIAGAIAPTTTGAQVISSIANQLKGFVNPRSRVTVSRITPAYYDGGGRYLQPVYTFLATISGAGATDDHVVGYVPIGKLAEPIPTIGGTHGRAPSAAAPGERPQNDGHVIANNNGGYIQLGEYANDDGTMLDIADGYNNGYTANSPWWAPAIVRTQWYWAATWEYVGSSNSFANAVDIAYTNPHGDWYTDWTNGRNNGSFSINQIGTGGNPGYGAAAGGILSTWILDSCEVIPSAYDLAATTGDGDNAFWPWFPVFQGLHRALGFRTQMLLGLSGMNWQIAYDQAQGVDAVSAFFSDVAAVDFNGTYGTYLDSHLGWNVNYDRVSVMVDDRNNGESIYGTAQQSAAYQLDNYWMGD